MTGEKKADHGRETEMPEGLGTRCKNKVQTTRHVGLYGHTPDPRVVVVAPLLKFPIL